MVRKVQKGIDVMLNEKRQMQSGNTGRSEKEDPSVAAPGLFHLAGKRIFPETNGKKDFRSGKAEQKQGDQAERGGRKKSIKEENQKK